jgi:hypothetical protein
MAEEPTRHPRRPGRTAPKRSKGMIGFAAQPEYTALQNRI